MPTLPSGAGAPRTIGRGLDPALAGGRAEPPPAVARHVDVDPITRLGDTHAQAIGMLASDHDREAEGQPGQPVVHGGLVAGMKVQMPWLAVVSLQQRLDADRCHEVVEYTCGPVKIAVRH